MVDSEVGLLRLGPLLIGLHLSLDHLSALWIPLSSVQLARSLDSGSLPSERPRPRSRLLLLDADAPGPVGHAHADQQVRGLLADLEAQLPDASVG